ncbi:hypothetical protein R1sor_004545 [Riccia sorocarpa]|uniref:Uncharacterized protein n=1 Tax=Riccia sorocarpa TaxID=122646 RepID=A0ABD3HL02_9MARC
MEGISSNAVAYESIATRKLQWDTVSWTSWKVLEGLLRDEMSDSERLDLLEAFGSCRSVRSVDASHLGDCLRSILEWETLLRSVKFNPVLEEITLTVCGKDMDTWSKLGRYWGEVLGVSSTLKRLMILGSRTRESDDVVEEYYGRRRSLFLEELVEGLRSNSTSPLEELVIKLLWSSAPVVQIADMVQYSSRLRTFFWDAYGFQDLDVTEIKALSDSLKQSSSLRTLEVQNGRRSMSTVLLRVFTGLDACRSVNNLRLWERFLEGLVSVLPQLMKASIPHITVWCVWDCRHDDDQSCSRTYEWRKICRALLEGTGVQTLNLQMTWMPSSLHEIEWAEQIIETSQRNAKLSFSLHFDFSSGKWCEESYTMSVLGLARLRDIHLAMSSYESLSFIEEVMHSISKNEDVETCSIGNPRGSTGWDSEGRRLVLESIFLRSSIKQLTLERTFFVGRTATEEFFKQLLLLTHRSTTLQKLEVQCEDWVLDGKVALLQEAMNRVGQRNARHAEFTSTIRQAGLHFSQIKAARTFICGAPYAGSKQLGLGSFLTQISSQVCTVFPDFPEKL